MKLIKYFLEFIVVIFFFIIFKILGIKLSSNLSCYFFTIFGPLIRSSNKISENLKIVFPLIDKNKESIIIKNMWCNYGRTFSEYMHLKNLYNNKNNYIKINHLEKFEKLKKLNKPILFFSGHFANFELLAMYIVKQGFELSALYRPLNNFFLNPIMEYLRKKYICKDQIPKSIPGKGKRGTRELIKRIKQRKNIALMIDQKVNEGITVKLFNKDAHTINIPAQLALKYDYILQPISIKRTGDINFEITIEDHIQILNDDDEKTITQRLNKKLEQMILNNPNQWIWTHKRWKI
jgi:KDO2-lipid IV(A) lauroyltransferase